MLSQQRPGQQPLTDLSEGEAGREQLAPRNDPMRTPRQLRERRPYGGRLVSHSNT
jgi:hypothetical protein